MHGQDITFAYGMWPVVAFNILLVLFFALSFVKPKGGVEWRSMGLFIGFIAALLTEMYGLPLTIYFLTQWSGNRYPVLTPFSHNNGHLWLVLLGLSNSAIAMTVLHLISNAIIFLGFYLLYAGWSLIYKSEGRRLVTSGIYSYMRTHSMSAFFDHSRISDPMADPHYADPLAVPHLRLLSPGQARRG